MLTCTAFASLLLRSRFSLLSLGCQWILVPEAWTNSCHKQRWRRSADQRSKESQDSAAKSPLQVCYFYEDLHKHNWWSISPLRAELQLSKFFREPWPHIKAFMLKLYSRFSFSSNVNWSFDFFFSWYIYYMDFFVIYDIDAMLSLIFTVLVEFLWSEWDVDSIYL